MKIGVIGDDFTGSGDIANTLAKAGAKTLQYVGVSNAPVRPGIDAAVIALKTRSIAPGDAVAQSLAACRWLVENGAEQIVFKYCSTFDSTPQGNIGPVAAALLEELQAPMALVCPAFPANGRTVFQGHLFVWDRLLSESGMERHPLTPMTDADIRRWLARQTVLPVGHVPLQAVRSPGLPASLDRIQAAGARLVVADAVTDEDLLALGAAAAGHRLVTGGSGIAMGLPRNFGILPRSPDAAHFSGVAGPALVLSGSCSAATRRQVQLYRQDHPSLELSADPQESIEEATHRALAFVQEHRDEAPLIYSTAEPEAVATAQEEHGAAQLAERFEAIFAALASQAVGLGVRRLVVAGGETSGAVASALGGSAFEIGPEIDTGVPVLLTDGEPALALALKSGNFGSDDFLAKAVEKLGGAG